MADHRDWLVELVRDRGYEYRDEPFELASGELSHDYVDGKRALAHGADLLRIARTIVHTVEEQYVAVGGLTMGADPLTHAVAVAASCDWFTVRKEPKNRGLNRWIEGAQLAPGTRVLLVEDVVTTGGSILTAHDRVREAAATVAAAVTLLDRGDAAEPAFRARGVAYYPLLTYSDLGIEPVGRGGNAPGSRPR